MCNTRPPALSQRAINRLLDQGFDLSDPEGVRASLRELLESGKGIKWQATAYTTINELSNWAYSHDAANEALREYEAAKLLKLRGYRVVRPADRPAPEVVRVTESEGLLSAIAVMTRCMTQLKAAHGVVERLAQAELKRRKKAAAEGGR